MSDKVLAIQLFYVVVFSFTLKRMNEMSVNSFHQPKRRIAHVPKYQSPPKPCLKRPHSSPNRERDHEAKTVRFDGLPTPPSNNHEEVNNQRLIDVLLGWSASGLMDKKFLYQNLRWENLGEVPESFRDMEHHERYV